MKKNNTNICISTPSLGNKNIINTGSWSFLRSPLPRIDSPSAPSEVMAFPNSVFFIPWYLKIFCYICVYSWVSYTNIAHVFKLHGSGIMYISFCNSLFKNYVCEIYPLIYFHCCLVFYCMSIPQLTYPFSCWWTYYFLFLRL